MIPYTPEFEQCPCPHVVKSIDDCSSRCSSGIIAEHFEVSLLFIFSYHFQVMLSEKTYLLETAEQKITELSTKVSEQQKLIQKLEDDILKVWNNYH